jgi:hypothetical protein
MTTGCSRRKFLQISGMAGLGHLALSGILVRIAHAATSQMTGLGDLPVPAGNGRLAFRRSGRGRHVSNAAKSYNANHLFATMQAARHGAHPGDRSKIVPVMISQQLWKEYFGSGRLAVDLRQPQRDEAVRSRSRRHRRAR